MSRPRTPRGTDAERGTVSLFMVLISLFVLLLAGLVLDGGLAIDARQRAADVAGQAARYAADDIDVAALRATGTVRVLPDACAKAEQFVARYDHDAGVSFGDCRVDGNDVTVQVAMTVKLQLLSVLPGFQSFHVTSQATAHPVKGI